MSKCFNCVRKNVWTGWVIRFMMRFVRKDREVVGSVGKGVGIWLIWWCGLGEGMWRRLVNFVGVREEVFVGGSRSASLSSKI